MKPTIYFIVAIIVLAVILMSMSKEGFQPEFLDKTQVGRTVALEDSSFSQQTNHMRSAPYSMGPIEGMETPFQINQYKGYVV